VLKAVRLVKKGKSATLARSMRQTRRHSVAQLEAPHPGRPTGGPFGDQQLVYNDEYVATELGQIGTQFDGPGHIGAVTSKGMYYYNALPARQGDQRVRLGPLGSSTSRKRASCAAACCSTRALRGATLPVPKENNASDPGIVTAKDVQAMVERQGLAPIGTGDCVFLYTGHGDLWHPRDWDKFDAAEKARASPSSTRASQVSAFPLRVSGRTQGDPDRRRYVGDGSRRQGLRGETPQPSNVT